MNSSHEHMHAHFGTHIPLLDEARFMSLVEGAEEFNGGSPFTLCRCSALGEDDINLTAAVRQQLIESRWIPEAGLAQLTLLSPANGHWFQLEMRLPLDPGHTSEIHYRFDLSYVQGAALEETIAFLEGVARDLDASFGYVHNALDEAIQDVTDPARYRALTGKEPAAEPLDPESFPGRSARAGRELITCRWLSIFGGRLAKEIGRERLLAAPCQATELDGGHVALRLYADPLAYDQPANRATQAAVRRHLKLDELVDTVSWEPVERRQTGEIPPIPEVEPEERQPPIGETLGRGVDLAVPSEFYLWASLYDSAPTGLPGEVDFYTEQARHGAGAVLELGCGTGRVTLPLARTGVPVVGLDPSPEVVNRLRRRLAREDSGMQGRTSLLLGDMSTVDVAAYGPFAAAFIPYRGINRGVRRLSLRSLLRKLHQLLQPGGIVAFNTFFPRVERSTRYGRALPQLVFSGTNPITEGEVLVYDTTSVNVIRQRMSTVRQLVEVDKGGEVVGTRYFRFELHYHYPDELRYLLELSGFDPRIYGGFRGEPLTLTSQEVVVVAQRT